VETVLVAVQPRYNRGHRRRRARDRCGRRRAARGAGRRSRLRRRGRCIGNRRRCGARRYLTLVGNVVAVVVTAHRRHREVAQQQDGCCPEGDGGNVMQDIAVEIDRGQRGELLTARAETGVAETTASHILVNRYPLAWQGEVEVSVAV